MIDKVVFGLSILLCSNLMVSSLGLKTQAVVLGVHTNTTSLTFIALIAGAILGYSLRGVSSGSGKQDDSDQW